MLWFNLAPIEPKLSEIRKNGSINIEEGGNFKHVVRSQRIKVKVIKDKKVNGCLVGLELRKSVGFGFDCQFFWGGYPSISNFSNSFAVVARKSCCKVCCQEKLCSGRSKMDCECKNGPINYNGLVVLACVTKDTTPTYTLINVIMYPTLFKGP